MGRLLLLTLALAALLTLAGMAGCTGASSQDREAASTDAHGELTCVTCHRGTVVEHGEPTVPSGSCTDSDCHGDGGPREVTVGNVRFVHRDHGGDVETVALDCAGCHEHAAGREPLAGGTDTCVLCHADGMDGDEPGDCRTCHQLPTHAGVTSQGVPVPHEGMPWIEGECVRCHFDVAGPEVAVESSTCASCHERLEALVTRSIGEDLHPDHAGVGCSACHTDGGHRIVAMSSAVELECAQCHVRSHGLEVAETFSGSAGSGACAACHRDAHEAQQRLVLGVLPGAHEARPSEKFLDGLTCRSCHAAPDPSAVATTADDVVTGQEISCAGCHRAEYATVLSWWNTGTEQRLRAVRSYVRAAESSLAGVAASSGAAGEPEPGSVAELLAHARTDVELLEAGGGQHNLPLGHDLLSEALSLAGDAYAAAGRSAPPAPDLGTRPSQGLCSYCHYRMDDRMRFQDMDERFHRDVLGVTGSRPGG